MADLVLTIGSTTAFQVAVTKNGAPVDLTGITSLSFVVQRTVGPAGYQLASWGLSGGGVIVQSPATAGIAVVTVTAAMLTWLQSPLPPRLSLADTQLEYTWSLVDALGNPTLDVDSGTMTLVAPP